MAIILAHFGPILPGAVKEVFLLEYKHITNIMRNNRFSPYTMNVWVTR